MTVSVFFFQAEDGIRDLVRSRGLGDVYKRQGVDTPFFVGVDDDLGIAAGLELMPPGHEFGPEFEIVEDLSLIHI